MNGEPLHGVAAEIAQAERDARERRRWGAVSGDPRLADAAAPNAIDWERERAERDKTRAQWAADVRAGRAFPAAGDLLAGIQVQPSPAPAEVSRVTTPAPGAGDLFALDLFGGNA